MNRKLFKLMLLVLCFSALKVGAQEMVSTHSSPLPSSYYINLNASRVQRQVPDVIDGRLSLKYEDRLSTEREMLVTIKDWQRNVKGAFNLRKTKGLNYYDVNLEDLAENWPTNATYIIEYKDEDGFITEVPFRLVEAPKKEGPSVNIFVNPISMHCDDQVPSSVTFVGDIEGGKAPYNLSWYVVNEQQSDLLYLPREAQLDQPGKSSTITVDLVLGYYVLLHVEDACGNLSKQMVHVQCEEESEQVNTLFVQPQLNIQSLKNGNR